MKKLTILYLGNFGNKKSDNTESHIVNAFEELGHKVIKVNEEDFGEVLDYKPDLFLYHKAGIGTYLSLNQWVKILAHITCPKVCWYFDKIWNARVEFIETITQFTDYVFLTDDTWRRRHKYNNVYCLMQGIGKKYKGIPREKYKCDVAFAGEVYSQERQAFVGILKNYYGDRFKVFSDVFNRDLADLCASAKIMVSPDSFIDEFRWSSRFYMTLGNEGFLVHPDLYGLKKEFTEGKHFAGYKNVEELILTIDYFLEHEEERKAIQRQGHKRCWQVATYKLRVEEMLSKIYETK